MQARRSSGIVAALVLFVLFEAFAQNLNRAEYFFDTDPGIGNGFNIAVTPAPNLNLTTNISTSGLPSGFHLLGLRVKESGGPWSLFETRGFYISSVASSTTNISRAEYYVDTDPGQGNATPITVPTAASVNLVFTVPTTSLSPGFHLLVVRIRDVFGRWSVGESRGFYITTVNAAAANISAAEYFFDTDPGIGNGTSISVVGGASVNLTIPVPTASLAPGFHLLGVRVKGIDGKWGQFETRGFYITGSVTNSAAIAGAEYFFDNDPGVGNGTPLVIPSGDVSNSSVSLPITGLSSGFHLLTIRIKDSSGRWGQFETRGFYVYPQQATGGNINAAEYFIDTDPGQGLATPLTVTTPGLTINQLFPIQISGVPPGPHKLGVRVRDAEGVWSEPRISDITVLNCTAPPTPLAPAVSRCNEGTVTLTASGAASGQTYKWYTAEFGGSSLFTGSGYTTPSLAATTDYYVSSFDPVTTCESARVKTTAQILNVSKPVLNASGTVTLCEGTSFLLAAPAGFASYQWSDGSATQQLLVTMSGTYSVIVNNGSCTLPSSDAVTFNFLARPSTPTINVVGNPEICNSGSVTLEGPTGASSYLWSNGATTSSITVSTTGSYRLTVTNAAGCASESSVAININVYTTPAVPTITVTGLTALCNDSFSVLSAPSGFTNYLWSNGATTQTVIVRDAGTYSVQVGNSLSCLSAVSAPVTITVTGQPCSGQVQNPNNFPPSIERVEISTAIRGKATIDLVPLVSDPNGANDINLTSLKVTGTPPSGATATIDNSGVLTVDYNQLNFSGSDYVVVQVCDLSASCSQQTIDINVAGDITPFNALSPNGDGMNEFLFLEFIEIIPDTQSNKVTIFNRWGSPVFEITDYNNDDRVFKGLDVNGKELPNGTYFFRIEFDSGKKKEEGFITLRR